VHLVQVLVEEDGDLEQRPCGEPGYAHAPISLQAEQGAKPLLAAARRAQLDPEVRNFAADVPQAVRGSRRDHDHIAAACRAALQPEAEAKLPGHALEAFPLARVDVRRHEASGPNEELASDATRRPIAEDDALPRHGVPDCVYALVDRTI
jgi:hypothetical protein